MKDRVMFYSKNDMSLLWQYDRIAELMQDKDKWAGYDDIEDVIELYQLMLVIDADVHPIALSDLEWEEYKDASKGVKAIVAKRFSRINDSTIEEELDKVDILYSESFWDILISFGGINRVSSVTLETLLNSDKVNIFHLLKNKQAVNAYGDVIKRFLQNNLCYARVLISEYLEKKDGNYTPYFFPKEMTKEDKVDIIERYIDSPEAGANDLKLLSVSQGNDQLPISPRMRLRATERFNEKIKQLSKTGVSFSYGVDITFKKQDEAFLLSQEGNDYHFSYNVNWIIENLDYPTLFNNFIYLFGFVDSQYRWQHISKKSMLGVLERTMGTKGKREYITGSGHNILEMAAQGQLQAYVSLLEDNGVLIEDMIKWFFESYLSEEFGAKGFIYNASSKNSTTLEKCRNIAIEIDSILKQYRLFCEDGEVNRNLFEISTEHMYISNVPSRIKDKYIYLDQDNSSAILHHLFSDQSLMLYCEGDKKYENAYKVLCSRKVNYNDLKPYQCSGIDYLVEKGILSVDNDGTIVFSKELLYVLYDLYKNEFICLNYYSDFKKEIQFLLDNKFVSEDSSLLAVPEQNYYNYIFNNSEYDNSKDLRNRYAHGNQTMKDDEMRNDYFTMLRMMVLIILKINEEFCLVKEDLEDK